MTEAQFNALLALYHECPDDFRHLPQATIDRFFDRLYAK